MRNAGTARRGNHPPHGGTNDATAPTSMEIDDDESNVVETPNVADLLRQVAELKSRMEVLQQSVAGNLASTAEGGTHVELSPLPDTNTLDPPPAKRRAETAIENGVPVVAPVKALANAPAAPVAAPTPKWEPKTEWFGLMAPSTSAARNREILNAVENEALYYKVPADVLHERVMKIASDSPDAGNFASGPCDGYELIKLLRGALESESVAKPIVMRQSDMTADTYFQLVTETLTKKERMLESRKETLKQIALRDRTLGDEKLRDLLAKIEAEKVDKLTSENANLMAQLRRLWMMAKVNMGVRPHPNDSESSNHKKRKHLSNPSSSPSASSSSTIVKKPSRPCKFCDAAQIKGDKAMHFDNKCTNEEAKAKFSKPRHSVKG